MNITPISYNNQNTNFKSRLIIDNASLTKKYKAYYDSNKIQSQINSVIETLANDGKNDTFWLGITKHEHAKDLDYETVIKLEKKPFTLFGRTLFTRVTEVDKKQESILADSIHNGSSYSEELLNIIKSFN